MKRTKDKPGATGQVGSVAAEEDGLLHAGGADRGGSRSGQSDVVGGVVGLGVLGRHHDVDHIRTGKSGSQERSVFVGADAGSSSELFDVLDSVSIASDHRHVVAALHQELGQGLADVADRTSENDFNHFVLRDLENCLINCEHRDSFAKGSELEEVATANGVRK